MNRWDISFDAPSDPKLAKVCFDFQTEPEPPSPIYANVTFAPSGGSVGVILTPATPCANVSIPKGAVTITCHDTATPPASEDYTLVIP